MIVQLEQQVQALYRTVRPRLSRVLERFAAQLTKLLRGERGLFADDDYRSLVMVLQRAYNRQLYRITLDALIEIIDAARRSWRVHFADELSDELVDYIADYLGAVWVNQSQQVARSVVEEIAKGINQGWTQAQFEQAIQQIIAQYTGYRLERVIRTEITRAYNYAIVYETIAYPEIAGYRYEVVVDDRTSSVCRPIAGKVVPAHQLRYVPPLHPNCRTILVPLLREDMPDRLEPIDLDATGQRFGLIPPFLAARLLEAYRVRFSDDADAEDSDFWRLWIQHERLIRKYCFVIAHGHQQDGEDLLAMTALRAYDRYHQYDPQKSSFATWCYHIAKSIYINHFLRVYNREITYVPEQVEFEDD